MQSIYTQENRKAAVFEAIRKSDLVRCAKDDQKAKSYTQITVVVLIFSSFKLRCFFPLRKQHFVRKYYYVIADSFFNSYQIICFDKKKHPFLAWQNISYSVRRAYVLGFVLYYVRTMCTHFVFPDEKFHDSLMIKRQKGRQQLKLSRIAIITRSALKRALPYDTKALPFREII